MIISLCTPVMNRLPDLRRTMPLRIKAAAICPPVEFVILDYGSQDGLGEYVEDIEYPDGITLVYRRIEARHWNTAHAYNLAILAASGEYACLMGADTYPLVGYFGFVRSAISGGCAWMEPEKLKGAIVIRRAEFVAAGGYDERFDLYGPEDRDMADRLRRRGGKMCTIPRGLMGEFHTPDDVKTENMRIRADKHTLSEMMRPIYIENRQKGATVANQGREWGRW